MSFFDLRFRKSPKNIRWEGMKPPDLSLSSLWADIQWHRALYKTNKLPPRQRYFFYLCRVLQLLAYGLGWKKGLKHANKRSQ